jgi:hypothetical protein
MTKTLPWIGLFVLAAAGIAAGQDQPPAQNQTDGGWRRFSDPAPAQAAPAQAAAAPDPEPVDRSAAQDPATAQAPAPAPAGMPPAVPARPANDPAAYGVPAELTLKPGAFVTVRINEMLSSNRNLIGDGFSAVLTQPLVADGVVVAQRGQTVYGQVAMARKSNASEPSVLALQLTGLTLVDGTQATVQSQLVSWEGGHTPDGAQAGTVVGTTAVGAGIGAAAGGGPGAAIGGGAGLAVGAIAALTTHNRPTVVYPETVMTFRLDTPLVVSTANAPQAFRYVGPNDYNSRQAPMQTRAAGPMAAPAPYGSYYGPGAAPYPYGVYPYPYPYGYWGPGVGLVFGRGFRRW